MRWAQQHRHPSVLGFLPVQTPSPHHSLHPGIYYQTNSVTHYVRAVVIQSMNVAKTKTRKSIKYHKKTIRNFICLKNERRYYDSKAYRMSKLHFRFEKPCAGTTNPSNHWLADFTLLEGLDKGILISSTKFSKNNYHFYLSS